MHSRVEHNRIGYIDIAKAIAMICVVTCHVMLYDFYGFQYSSTESVLHQFLASFQMPLWFFLSGMVARTEISVSDIPPDLYKRFRNLIIPAIVVGLPFSCFIGKGIEEFFTNGMKQGYWYMFVLFEMLVINYVFSLPFGKNRKALLYFLSALAWLVSYRHLYLIPQDIRWLFCIDLLVRYFPFFVIGNIVRKQNLYNLLFNWKMLVASVLVWILSSMYPPPYFLHELEGGLIQNSYISILYKLLQNIQEIITLSITLAKVICVVCLCRMLINFSQHNLLEYVGRHTIFIYLFHYYILICISMPFLNNWFADNGNILIDVLSAVVPVTLVMVICVGISRLFDKIPKIKKLIFFN